jgi:hypothetical protein
LGTGSGSVASSTKGISKKSNRFMQLIVAY